MTGQHGKKREIIIKKPKVQQRDNHSHNLAHFKVSGLNIVARGSEKILYVYIRSYYTYANSLLTFRRFFFFYIKAGLFDALKRSGYSGINIPSTSFYELSPQSVFYIYIPLYMYVYIPHTLLIA